MATLKIFPSDEPERTVDLLDERITLGRVVDNQIALEDGSISSHHAEFLQQGDTYLLRDLGSTNGTFVNGEAITETLLAPGDEIRFGSVAAVFSPQAEESALPLPDSASMAPTEAGLVSARPANFVNSSPFTKSSADKDTITHVAYGIAAVALIAFLASLYAIFVLLQAPQFAPV